MKSGKIHVPAGLIFQFGEGLPHHALRPAGLANPGSKGGAAAWPVTFNHLKSFAINLFGG
ncbi:hypothetical protein LP414_12860 [Polaromonas sp. P1(28)-13]|nr:hypothetical protein LP417_17635 [Polaromonas sp. P1-6]UUZ69788.1 hypothetical protein LP416_10890 [Polaromonas sp. P2-4]UUZ77822.1 hypothetical protein LP414_12860 [Polaromonas sp. P1(28)-13]